MDRREGQRLGSEGGRGGPALQQLLPACDSPVPAVQRGQSHGAVGREGAPRPSLRSPRTELGDSPQLPSPRLPLARPAGEEETRAARRHLLLRLRRRRRACCCRRRGARRFLSGVKGRAQSGGSPSRAPATGNAQPQARWTPRLPRPSLHCPRAPARPGPARRSERAAAQDSAPEARKLDCLVSNRKEWQCFAEFLDLPQHGSDNIHSKETPIS